MFSRLSTILSAILVVACTGTSPQTQDTLDEISAPGVVFGQAPAAAGGVPSVVMLSAESGRSDSGPVFDPEPVIDQFGLVFSPTILLVRVGQTVRFTNSESLAHNVNLRHVDTDLVVLDADTDPAETAHYTFEESGGYDVTCNVHPGMTAFVFVSPTPYAVVADLDGEFTLSGVPPGSYTLTVWSTDTALVSERAVEVGEGPTELEAGPAS